jgi:hypothetical protein
MSLGREMLGCHHLLLSALPTSTPSVANTLVPSTTPYMGSGSPTLISFPSTMPSVYSTTQDPTSIVSQSPLAHTPTPSVQNGTLTPSTNVPSSQAPSPNHTPAPSTVTVTDTPTPVVMPVPTPVLTVPATPVPTNSNPTLPATGGGGESRLIAYVGNWQVCPTEAQYSQYTHMFLIAFAVC